MPTVLRLYSGCTGLCQIPRRLPPPTTARTSACFCVGIGSRARNNCTLQINMQLVWRRSKHISPRCDDRPRLSFDFRDSFILVTLSSASLRGKHAALEFRRCRYDDAYSSSQPFLYRARLSTSCPELSPNRIKSSEYGGKVHKRVF